MNSNIQGVSESVAKVAESVAEVAESVQALAQHVDECFMRVDKRFEQVDKRFDKLEHEVGTIKASMVTKTEFRSLDQKVNRLVVVLASNKTLSPAEAAEVLS